MITFTKEYIFTFGQGGWADIDCFPGNPLDYDNN